MDLGLSEHIGPDLHLVQFIGPTQGTWLDELRASGMEIVQYIYPFTYICLVPKTGSPAGSTCVRRSLGRSIPSGVSVIAPGSAAVLNSLVPSRALLVRCANTDRVVDEIAALGARIGQRRALDKRFEIVGFDIAGTRLEDVACIPGVYSVQTVPTDGGSRSEMSTQVCANNVDQDNLAFPGYLDWLSGIGFDGSGVIIANVDEGIQNTHPDLVSRLISCTGTTCGGGTSSMHGTHTAGIMAADGSSGVLDGYGFLRGLGMAPGAMLVEQYYIPYFTQPGGVALLISDSSRNGASLSGNSWGPSGSPHGYDSDTMQADIGVRDADPNTPGNQPLTYVLSFMNGYGGTSTQGTPDEAKNILTVGSTKMQTSSGVQLAAIDDLSSNSAHGPALDGRTIPHLVAPGCHVDSTIPTDNYRTLCGTSMSSPHVSGAVALFIEYYRLQPRYVADPSPALIKAAFLAVAHDLAGNLDADGGVLGHPFDSKQGWGRLDVEAVVAPRLAVRYFDQPLVFDETGEQWTRIITARDPNQPIRIMLAWTDAPGHGLGGSTPAWNNDLDLQVVEGADIYHGNSFAADGWSQAGGSADYRNNTEGVFIGPTASGTYTLRVIASNINSNGVPNFGDTTDQDFAVVCYNCDLQAGFSLTAEPSSVDICVPENAVYEIEIEPVSGFTDPITLSVEGDLGDMSASFNPNPVSAPGSSTLTIGATAAGTGGEYNLQIVGAAGATAHSTAIQLWLYEDVSEPPMLNTPADGASDVALQPALTWNAAAGAVTYEIEVATDAGFNEIVIGVTGISETEYTPNGRLAIGTEYFWRVRADNPCGQGSYSAGYSFTTRVPPELLLVDDDDNIPDVHTYYTNTLTVLGRDFDIWETENTDNEPSAVDLEPYSIVIWFTGDAYGGAAGPGSAGENALATFLNSGKNLFVSSQEYYYDHGLTTFMDEYLGVRNVTSDVGQTIVTGTGSVFGGLGPYTLDYPFPNYSDRVRADETAEVAFNGNQAEAAVNKNTDVYRTVFFGFPFETLASAAERETVLVRILDWFRPWADCNDNGIADHADIAGGTSIDLNGNGVPDECEPGRLGDMNCDDEVSELDVDAFVLALIDPAGYATAYPNCNINLADCNWDGNLNSLDIDSFIELLIEK